MQCCRKDEYCVHTQVDVCTMCVQNRTPGLCLGQGLGLTGGAAQRDPVAPLQQLRRIPASAAQLRAGP